MQSDVAYVSGVMAILRLMVRDEGRDDEGGGSPKPLNCEQAAVVVRNKSKGCRASQPEPASQAHHLIRRLTANPTQTRLKS